MRKRSKWSKKIISVFVMLCMCFTTTCTVFAETDYGEDSITPEMEQYAKEALENIENNIDEIHKEIEEYQASIPSTTGVSYGGFQYLDGDIFVTKSTSLSGVMGHAGILVGTKVLDITNNPNYNYNKKIPEAMSLSTWYSRYPSTMVLRYTNGRDIPVGAGWYGKTFYIDGEGSDNKYLITSLITSLTHDYCSSLVWKCYHYGAGFDFEIYIDTPNNGHYGRPDFISPYDFITFREHNGFKTVYSKNW
ncbi:MAG: hypothetical protein HFE90_09915 [Firmicutes bacterium]|nr:hypothetical protein [Bacillota bacterium]